MNTDRAVPPADVPKENDPLVGTVLADRYRILRRLGAGGMGVVYLGEHLVIEKLVAIKMLLPEMIAIPEIAARFLQEAKSAARIKHENVVSITDYGQVPDGPTFFVMEYLEGEDLETKLKRQGSLSWQEACPILIQVCRALAAAHSSGIIHRDLKTSNIFLVRRKDVPDFVKVFDFGIAKLVSTGGHDPHLTRTGFILGTLEYMSPEQARGIKLDARTDIWALGVVAYELLTGKVPFKSDTIEGSISQILIAPIIPPRDVRPDLEISKNIEAVILRALERDPDKRYASMDDFAEALSKTIADKTVQKKARKFRKAFATTAFMKSSLVSSIIKPKIFGFKRSLFFTLILAALIISGTVGFTLAYFFPLSTTKIATRPLRPISRQKISKVVSVPPQSIPTTVDIIISTLPNDAIIEVPGHKPGQSPLKFALPARTSPLTVHIHKTGFYPRHVEVIPDRNYEYQFELQPVKPAKKPRREQRIPAERELDIKDPYGN